MNTVTPILLTGLQLVMILVTGIVLLFGLLFGTSPNKKKGFLYLSTTLIVASIMLMLTFDHSRSFVTRGLSKVASSVKQRVVTIASSVTH